MNVDHGNQSRRTNDNEILRISNPKDRMSVQEQITKRASTDCRQSGYYDDAQEIHPGTTRSKRTAHGKNCNSE
jgi:hypothetical protein